MGKFDQQRLWFIIKLNFDLILIYFFKCLIVSCKGRAFFFLNPRRYAKLENMYFAAKCFHLFHYKKCTNVATFSILIQTGRSLFDRKRRPLNVNASFVKLSRWSDAI